MLQVHLFQSTSHACSCWLLDSRHESCMLRFWTTLEELCQWCQRLPTVFLYLFSSETESLPQGRPSAGRRALPGSSSRGTLAFLQPALPIWNLTEGSLKTIFVSIGPHGDLWWVPCKWEGSRRAETSGRPAGHLPSHRSCHCGQQSAHCSGAGVRGVGGVGA